jgi:hypothetical protein
MGKSLPIRVVNAGPYLPSGMAIDAGRLVITLKGKGTSFIGNGFPTSGNRLGNALPNRRRRFTKVVECGLLLADEG